MSTAIITWDEDRKTGTGKLTCEYEDGTIDTIEHDDPIDERTDSSAIAGLFGSFDWVDHDREYIHVGVSE